MIAGAREPEILKLDISRETSDVFAISSHLMPGQEQRDMKLDAFQDSREGSYDSNPRLSETRIEACALRDRLREESEWDDEEKRTRSREERSTMTLTTSIERLFFLAKRKTVLEKQTPSFRLEKIIMQIDAVTSTNIQRDNKEKVMKDEMNVKIKLPPH